MHIVRRHFLKVRCIGVDFPRVGFGGATVGSGYGDEDTVRNIDIECCCGWGSIGRSKDTRRKCSCRVIVLLCGKRYIYFREGRCGGGGASERLLMVEC